MTKIIILIIVVITIVLLLLCWKNQENQDRFMTLLKNKRVCIVAFSDKLDKKEYGKQIDSYDVVIRMNNHHFGGEKQLQYGTKRTIEIHNFSYVPKIAKDTKLVISAHPLKVMGPAWVKHFQTSINSTGIPHIEFDSQLFEYLRKEIQAFPGTGTCALMYLKPYIQYMKCFHIYAMDNYASVKYYQDLKSCKHGHHNHCNERDYLNKHFYNTDLPNMKRILE